MNTSVSDHRYKWGLFAIIVLSIALRWFLVFQGGQNYWPDEARYARAKYGTQMLLEGDLGNAMPIFDAADHMFFKVLGILPALFEIFVVESWRVPGMFYSSFFALTLLMVWRILRRVGADPKTSLLSAALLAGCNSFFLYSRHLVPYDLAMAVGLCAVYIGLKPDRGFRASVACGLAGGLTFMTYTGYWTLGAFAVFTHSFYKEPHPARGAQKLLVSGAALVFVPAFLCAVSTLLGGGLVESFTFFSRSVTQGDYGDGWSLPFIYLWHTEHFNLPLWAVASALAAFWVRRMKNAEAAKFGFFGLLFFYSVMVLVSAGFHKFVVYGRLARQLAPFFCMLTASALAHSWTKGTKFRIFVLILAAATTVQSGLNMREPFGLTFPIEFRKAMLVDRANFPKGQYDLLNADHIFPYPIQSIVKYQKVVFQRPHPLEYPPYQYEGFTREQRDVLRKTDISMRLMLRE